MKQFEDIDPEYRQGTYLGRLPRELRQLTTRYKESCDYGIDIQDVIRKPDVKTLVLYNKTNTLGSHIPFKKGIRNEINMRDFISRVKQGIQTDYRVSTYFYIEMLPSRSREEGKPILGLYNSLDPVVYIVVIELCRELEDALYEMERFQNS